MNRHPIQIAYEELESGVMSAERAAAVALEAGDLGTLTIATVKVNNVIDGFRNTLEKETIEVPGKGKLVRVEYEAFQTVSNNNGIDLLTLLERIRAIEHWRVTELKLSWLKLTDISGLAPLTQLRSLNLSHNWIKDFAALSGMEKLAWLDLRDNPIQGISPLKNLAGLVTLNLQGITTKLSAEDRGVIESLQSQGCDVIR